MMECTGGRFEVSIQNRTTGMNEYDCFNQFEALIAKFITEENCEVDVLSTNVNAVKGSLQILTPF